MGAPLSIAVAATADGCVVRVSGDLDMDSSPRLRDELQRAMKGARSVKLDLEGVGYVDSSGVAVFIQALKWARRESVDFRLVNPSVQVGAVMDLARVRGLFVIEGEPR